MWLGDYILTKREKKRRRGTELRHFNSRSLVKSERNVVLYSLVSPYSVNLRILQFRQHLFFAHHYKFHFWMRIFLTPRPFSRRTINNTRWMCAHLWSQRWTLMTFNGLITQPKQTHQSEDTRTHFASFNRRSLELAVHFYMGIWFIDYLFVCSCGGKGKIAILIECWRFIWNLVRPLRCVLIFSHCNWHFFCDRHHFSFHSFGSHLLDNCTHINRRTFNGKFNAPQSNPDEWCSLITVFDDKMVRWKKKHGNKLPFKCVISSIRC